MKQTTYEQEALKAIRIDRCKGVFFGFLTSLLSFHLIAYVYGIVWLVSISLSGSGELLWNAIFVTPTIFYIGAITVPVGYGLYKVLDYMGFNEDTLYASTITFYIVLVVRILISIMIQYL